MVFCIIIKWLPRHRRLLRDRRRGDSNPVAGSPGPGGSGVQFEAVPRPRRPSTPEPAGYRPAGARRTAREVRVILGDAAKPAPELMDALFQAPRALVALKPDWQTAIQAQAAIGVSSWPTGIPLPKV